MICGFVAASRRLMILLWARMRAASAARATRRSPYCGGGGCVAFVDGVGGGGGEALAYDDPVGNMLISGGNGGKGVASPQSLDGGNCV